MKRDSDIVTFTIQVCNSFHQFRPNDFVHSVPILRLIRLAKSSHSLSEKACNYGLTPRDETRIANIKKEAGGIAEGMGFSVYFQGDPRGAPLYLLPRGMTHEDASQSYTSGIVVPW